MATMAQGYACMQVHNFTAGQTLFAYNSLGNQATGNPDYVFAANAASFPSRVLTVLVRPTP